MFRRIPSFILALSLLLQPNPCASEPVSSLRSVNSRETKPVLDLLTAGLEEDGETESGSFFGPMDRRNFLKTAGAAWAEAETGFLQRLASGQISTVGIRETVDFLIGLQTVNAEKLVAAVKGDPKKFEIDWIMADTIDFWGGKQRSLSSRTGIQAGGGAPSVLSTTFGSAIRKRG